MWQTARDQIIDKHVQQVITWAGSGKLLDNSETSSEFRSFLSQVPAEILERYIFQCLTDKFDGNGFALQDLVNQLGARLGFEVESGRYRGVSGLPGHDGLWRSKTGHSLVVEVKTTASFTIDLDGIADYRNTLIATGTIEGRRSSILIIVGRDENTSSLEAQIRGSPHAWNTRLVGVEAMIKLMNLVTQNLDTPDLVNRITEVLAPQEFTRVDGIVDLVFFAAEDVIGPSGPESDDETPNLILEQEPQERKPAQFNEACVTRCSELLGVTLVRRSRSLFSSPDSSIKVLCLVSRRYEAGRQGRYWYAFNDHSIDTLEEAASGYVALGCGSPGMVLLIPWKNFKSWLDGIHTTTRENGRYYFHIQVMESEDSFRLARRSGHSDVPLDQFLLSSLT